MLPACLPTGTTPAATIHFAGDLSLVETHWSKVLPSKRTIASEGAAADAAPGVTTAGVGDHCSVSCGFGTALGAEPVGGCWAIAHGVPSRSRLAQPAASPDRRVGGQVPPPCRQ